MNIARCGVEEAGSCEEKGDQCECEQQAQPLDARSTSTCEQAATADHSKMSSIDSIRSKNSMPIALSYFLSLSMCVFVGVYARSVRSHKCIG